MFVPLRLYLRSLILEKPTDFNGYYPRYSIQYIFQHSLLPFVELLEIEYLRILRGDERDMRRNVADFRYELFLCLMIAVRLVKI